MDTMRITLIVELSKVGEVLSSVEGKVQGIDVGVVKAIPYYKNKPKQPTVQEPKRHRFNRRGDRSTEWKHNAIIEYLNSTSEAKTSKEIAWSTGVGYGTLMMLRGLAARGRIAKDGDKWRANK